MNLDGVVMAVTATDEKGVVGAGTFVRFVQRGSRVLGRYAGGAVSRGSLVGTVVGAQLSFRYVQVEASGEVHGGRSVCDVERGHDGRLRVIEHFAWRTRAGSGTNVFEEVETPFGS